MLDTLKMSNYVEQCFRDFVKTRKSYQVQIRFEIYPNEIQVYFYYDEDSDFNLTQTIEDLDGYLRYCNVHKLNYNIYAHVGINNSDGFNYSQLCFNRSLKRLTRLDIQKR